MEHKAARMCGESMKMQAWCVVHVLKDVFLTSAIDVEIHGSLNTYRGGGLPVPPEFTFTDEMLSPKAIFISGRLCATGAAMSVSHNLPVKHGLSSNFRPAWCNSAKWHHRPKHSGSCSLPFSMVCSETDGAFITIMREWRHHIRTNDMNLITTRGNLHQGEACSGC